MVIFVYFIGGSCSDGTGCYGNIMNVDTTGASAATASQDHLPYTGLVIKILGTPKILKVSFDLAKYITRTRRNDSNRQPDFITHIAAPSVKR